jgi:hypothetical protein
MPAGTLARVSRFSPTRSIGPLLRYSASLRRSTHRPTTIQPPLRTLDPQLLCAQTVQSRCRQGHATEQPTRAAPTETQPAYGVSKIGSAWGKPHSATHLSPQGRCPKMGTRSRWKPGGLHYIIAISLWDCRVPEDKTPVGMYENTAYTNSHASKSITTRIYYDP